MKRKRTARTASGKFARGNPGGPGNPNAQRTADLRALLMQTVTENDLRTVLNKLVRLAKGGDLAAIRELLDRVFGKPKPFEEQVVLLEQMAQARQYVATAKYMLEHNPGYADYLREAAMRSGENGSVGHRSD